MKPIIEVNNLYKKYKFGKVQPYITLRDSLVELIRKPLQMITNKSKKMRDDEFWALKDVSFSVSPGESIGIIGRNGAGKSTLLKVLGRITPPTRGVVTLHGRVASLLEIGTGFHQELSGRENIYLNGAILGMRQKEINRKFDEIVDFSEIEQFLDTPVKYYSSGMYMRLAFAVAAHLNSEILIVDEVLAVGDAAFQRKCLGKMENVASQGKTVLFVSHNMQAVRRLCCRVLLLDKGKIISDAQTEQSLAVYNRLLRNITLDENTAIQDNSVRRGSGVIRFTKIDLLNINNRKQLQFKTGEMIRFKISYKVFKNIQGLVVSISLRSGITREIITSDQHVLSKKLVFKGSVGTVKIDWPYSSLCPGEYPIYFYIGPFKGRSTDFDVLDDLTSPLIITDKMMPNSPDSQQKYGYFIMPSKLTDFTIDRD